MNTTTPDIDYIFKVILIGDSNVGKTCMMLRYMNDEFHETTISTVGVDFQQRTVQYTASDGNPYTCKLHVWDTAGQERFRTITCSYYRGAHAILVVFALDDIESFHNATNWLSEINRYGNETCHIICVGNKSDQPRKIHQALIDDFVEANGITYHEVSARTGDGIDKLFTSIVGELVERNVRMQAKTKKLQHKHSKEPGTKRKRRCILM